MASKGERRREERRSSPHCYESRRSRSRSRSPLDRYQDKSRSDQASRHRASRHHESDEDIRRDHHHDNTRHSHERISSRDHTHHHSNHQRRDDHRHGDRSRNSASNHHDDAHHSSRRGEHSSKSRQHSGRHGNPSDRQSEDLPGGGPKREEEDQDFEFGAPPSDGSEKKSKIEGPNFAVSGKLAEDTNTYKGVVIKYSEPPEARQPKVKWRLYPFKGEETLPVLHVHRQSAYLIGRDRHIVDLPVDHPSCSKQHAALQYRLVDFTRTNGSSGRATRPYIIDLESTNGTYINNDRIEPARYYQLKEKDVIKFGFSSREYVLLHENSATTPPSEDGGEG